MQPIIMAAITEVMRSAVGVAIKVVAAALEESPMRRERLVCPRLTPFELYQLDEKTQYLS